MNILVCFCTSLALHNSRRKILLSAQKWHTTPLFHSLGESVGPERKHLFGALDFHLERTAIAVQTIGSIVFRAVNRMVRPTKWPFTLSIHKSYCNYRHVRVCVQQMKCLIRSTIPIHCERDKSHQVQNTGNKMCVANTQFPLRWQTAENFMTCGNLATQSKNKQTPLDLHTDQTHHKHRRQSAAFTCSSTTCLSIACSVRQFAHIHNAAWTILFYVLGFFFPPLLRDCGRRQHVPDTKKWCECACACRIPLLVSISIALDPNISESIVMNF